MSSNTFFGEVNELNSRAIYWSDNESDEESEVVTEVDVVLNTNDNFNANCNTVYVSLAKSKYISSKNLTSIGSVSGGPDDKTTVADILSVNETSIWIRLNINHQSLKNHLMVKTISSLMKQVLAKCVTKPLVCIISKDFSRDESSDDVITYLSSDKNNLNVIPSELKSRPLLAPKMITDLVESAVFEYCLVFETKCISIILPEMQSKPFTESFIPKAIVDCVKQMNHFSDSNIYI